MEEHVKPDISGNPGTPQPPDAAAKGSAPSAEANMPDSAGSAEKLHDNTDTSTTLDACLSTKFEQVDIAGSAVLNQSPIGAEQVTYNINNFGAGADIIEGDPSEEIDINDLQQDLSAPEETVDKLHACLLQTRALFIYHEASGSNAFKALRNAILRRFNQDTHVFRTTRKSRPINFDAFKKSRSFQYKKSAVFMLGSNTMPENRDFLEESEMRGVLKKNLEAINSYLIVPVQKSELLDDFDELARKQGDHMWHIPAEKGEPETACKLDHDNVIGKTAQFVVAFFSNIDQTDFDELVESLLIVQQQISLPTIANVEQKPTPAQEPTNLPRQWHLSKDKLLQEANISFRRDKEDQDGFVFRNEQDAETLPLDFLKSARGWMAQQFATLQQRFLDPRRLSLPILQGYVRLLIQLHEYGIITIDERWLLTMFDQARTRAEAGLLLGRFHYLVHSLLRQSNIKPIVLVFLQELANQCRQDLENWLSKLMRLAPVVDWVQGHHQSNESVNRILEVCRLLPTLEHAPLNAIYHRQNVIVSTLTEESAREILPILLSACEETESNHRLSASLPQDENLMEVTRPTAFGGLRCLIQYLQNRSADYLCDFASAALELSTKAGAESTASIILLDAFHVALVDLVRKFNRHGDAQARQFLDTYFDGEDQHQLASLLAQTTHLRSPPSNLVMQPKNTRSDSAKLMACIRMYEELILALRCIEGGRTSGLRLRSKALMKPFIKNLTLKERGDFRLSLNFRKNKALEKSKLSKGDTAAQQSADIISLMMASLP